MLQIRLHGRGGQGVVTAAEMLTLAAFYEGHFAQAFPSFDVKLWITALTNSITKEMRSITRAMDVALA